MTTREIKFRAWRYETNSMLDSKQSIASIIQRYIKWFWEWMQNGNWKVEPKDYEIMQYTWIQDKNGKEIYEGDIVEYLYYDDGDYEEIVRKEVKYYAPYFSFGWTVKTYPNKDFLPKTPNPLDMEVIGNIYENPELIK